MDLVSDETLVAEIMSALEIDHQYVRRLAPHAEGAIAQVRRCGRKAGRALGYKIRTFAIDPAQREDGRCVVFVVVIESTAEDDARIAERSKLLISKAMKSLPF